MEFKGLMKRLPSQLREQSYINVLRTSAMQLS